VAGEITQFPHCDQRILHAPGECEFCDRHPGWQQLRQAWGIAFTGHPPRAGLPKCGRRMRNTFPGYGSDKIRCQQPAGHQDECRPYPAWDVLPCPADATRPPGASNDHRRWGGNKPTTAASNPAWPAETTASKILYGDKGGRQLWPLREQITRRARRPIENWRMRHRGWRRDGPFWIRKHS